MQMITHRGREKGSEIQRQSGEFWDAAKVTEIKRARRKEAAMDNEKRQKETKLFKRVFN